MSNRYMFRFNGCFDNSSMPIASKIQKPDSPELINIYRKVTTETRDLTYTFYSHQHPFVEALMNRILQGSIKSLLDADTELNYSHEDFKENSEPDLNEDMYKLYLEFFEHYKPGDSVSTPYPVHNIDFTPSGAYSSYNWELFFHVPFLLATHLSRNGSYQEAQKWFHLLFDPTDDSDAPTPERYWKVQPFQTGEYRRLEQILINLSTGADPKLRRETIDSIMAWKNKPFRPHVIARYRQSAYMLKTVTAYLDNLIDWGDSLFRRDSGESINEATMLYVLAANILGPRPQPVPTDSEYQPKSYGQLRENLDELCNAMVELENELVGDGEDLPFPGNYEDDGRQVTINSIGRSLYFCVPNNQMILDYWDTVTDRLYKIRNSLNIQGIFRQLPLFEPPIDPALLARAASAGLDVSSIVSGFSQPLPLVRFRVMLQKAQEVCQEVKGLGNTLLSVLEKKDAEKLSIIRLEHEIALYGIVEKIKYSHWQEAVKNEESLLISLNNAIERFVYYERLLGVESGDIEIPELDELDVDKLEKLSFKSEEPVQSLREIDVDIAGDMAGGGGCLISSFEKAETELLKSAQKYSNDASTSSIQGSIFSMYPDLTVSGQPTGVGVQACFGGSSLSKMMQAITESNRGLAGMYNFKATATARTGSYKRREQEWAYQSNLVAGEITSIFKQLRAAQIRSHIAEKELESHRKQMENFRAMDCFLKEEKTTGEGFYIWMKREVKGLYDKCYQFAFDLAKKAERCLQHELGDSSLSYLQFGYNAGREGLLAGEKLWFDIKQMEMAYLDLNKREYELTKHVSLAEVCPEGLIKLRATGSCEIKIPEVLFDLDCPGHYFRRIKSVGISIPCVTGPYSGVNCTLTLQRSTIRKSPDLAQSYAKTGENDTRFSDYYGSVDSVVTSSGQNDTGMFETNLNDERYLPFEGSGVDSKWLIELPGKVRKFDYDTISDVIIHMRYTARQGGTLLKLAAEKNLIDLIGLSKAYGCSRLLSLKHDFPMAWNHFKSADSETDFHRLEFELEQKHFPFWSRSGSSLDISGFELFAKPSVNTPSSIAVRDASYGMEENKGLNGLITCELSGTDTDMPELGEPYSILLNNNSMSNIWMIVKWKANME